MTSAARPASTIVLLRDGADSLEVLVVRRHGKSGFMAGATVFPGGKVDAVDGPLDEPAVPGRGFYVSAARELHEEAGVLLALDGDGQPIPAEASDAALVEVDAIRDGHRVDAAQHHAILARRRWSFDVDALVPFAHWVTPTVEPRRFDTWFFAAVAPEGQEGRLDGHETTDLGWLSPAQAIAQHEGAGDIWLPPPTYHTLHRLAELGGTARSALGALARSGPVPCWQPHFVADSDDGPLIVLPEDPLHPSDTGPCFQHRFALRDGRFRYICER